MAVKQPKSKRDLKRLENWSSRFPTTLDASSERLGSFQKLSSRELAIVTAAILDAALAQLIPMRLIDDTKAVDAFIGADGSPKAPLGSFSARIDAAYLLGIVTRSTADRLNALREVRNVMGHRIEASLLDHPNIRVIMEKWIKELDQLREQPAPPMDTQMTERRARSLLLTEFMDLELRLLRNLRILQTKKPTTAGPE
jgi:DNA-binding MltR family transcriptional regulator